MRQRKVDKSKLYHKVSDAVESLSNASSDESILKEGDRVKIDIQQVMSHNDWKILSPKYKEFVTCNKDTVFTVKYDKSRKSRHSSVVTFKECEDWLWWENDLIRL